jgi:MFS family permease
VKDEQRAGASQKRGYRNVVLGFLVLAYTLNFVDRSIVGIIGQAIKVDLLLTDTQLGLLGGLAFALLYTSVGLPIARVAERSNRVNLISIAIVIWSGFTALCGLAQSFVQLLLFRAGVGIGEAGLSPAAHSLISDYFEPQRRASALAVYGLGIPIGAMIGTVAGGWIAQSLDWRWAFMLVGLPGILVALSLRVFVKEPRRNAAAARGVSVSHEAAELWGTVKTLLGRWPTANVVLGVTVLSFADYGIGTFAAPYFVRQFGLGLATVGLFLGVVVGVSSAAGTLLGGFFSDWLSKRSFSAYAFVPAIGIVIAGPIYMLAYTQGDWHWAIGLIVLPAILSSLYLGPSFGVIQNTVDVRQRATATAVLLFIVNLIGLGAGPPFVGWLIDQLAAWHFTNAQSLDVVHSAISAFSHSTDVAFAASCPGGVAPAGADADLIARCAHASAIGTRQGILVTLLFYFWAASHFFLASMGLEKLMRQSLKP